MLLSELICPMTTAALDFDDISVANAQKGPLIIDAAVTVTQRTAIIAPSECTNIAAVNPIAPMASGSAVCMIRSPVLSEWRPHRYIPTLPNAKGTAFSKPTCMVVSPTPLRIWGCQSARPLVTDVRSEEHT